MSDIQKLMDAVMCSLWIVTYTLVLIGSIKYRYPLIAPMTQAVIAPLEFAVTIDQLADVTRTVNYAYIAYIYWSIIEIGIIVVTIKLGGIKRKDIVPYMLFIVVLTAVMYELVVVQGEMLLFTFVNTTIGVFIWMLYVRKKSYPAKPLILAIFITKFIADILAGCIYFNFGNWLVKMMCIGLPTIHALFFVVYYRKKKYGHNSSAERKEDTNLI